jgi:hypothetical protein
VGDTDAMKGTDAGSCPFCRGRLAISKEPPAVMHTLPLCPTYAETGPIEFLRRVNAARRRATP